MLVIAIVFLIAYLVYGLTWPPTLYWQDAGIYLSAIKTLGIAYPPGFPLYTMLGYLWTRVLPWGTFAQQVHSFSALFGAGTAGIMSLSTWKIFSQLNCKKGKLFWQGVAAMAIGLTTAFSYSLWAQSINAEVYSLHAFFTALILYITILLGRNKFIFPGTGKQKFLWLFLAMITGLSFANHPVSLAFLPPLGYIFQLTNRGKKKRRSGNRGWLLFLIGVFVPYESPR